MAFYSSNYPGGCGQIDCGAERGANATVTVDLENQEIKGPDGGVMSFDIDPFKKYCLSAWMTSVSV